MKTLVIIPAYNEEQSIVSLYQELKTETDFDVIVVNDASTDQTLKVLRESNIPHLDLPFNMGISGAMRTGFRYAMENEYEHVLKIDADGQHSPKYLKEMVALSHDYDLVVGSRFIEETSYKQTFMRKLGAKFIEMGIKVFTGTKLHDPTSGMICYDAKAVKFLANDVHELMEPEYFYIFLNNGFTVKELPVEMNQREFGSSHFSSVFSSIEYMIEFFFTLVVFKNLKIKE